MSELTAHIKQAFEDFDASYHKLRAHLLHTLGLDEHQLAHDAAAAAKPIIAEAEQDAKNLAEETVSGAPAKPAGFDAAAATKMAVAPKTTTPAADTSWSPKTDTTGNAS